MVLAEPTAIVAAGAPFHLKVLPKTLEKRVPHLAFRRFGAVLDLGEQLRLDPDAPVRDPFRVGLRLADQRLQALLQIVSRDVVEAVVDFAGIDQVAALTPAEIDTVPFSSVQSEARESASPAGRTAS
jgi:hypothetical protein